MREKVSSASSYRREQLPTSLVQRLELMQHLARAAQADSRALVPLERPRPPRRGAHVIVLAWFSLGVLTSGAMGFGAILGLRSLAAGGSPVAGAAAVASWSYPGGEWDTVQVAIDRTQRAWAPFALEVAGADGPGLEVVMHGLPAGVKPSRGVPVAAATWLLTRADLDGLHLTLDASAPEAFNVKVAVLTPPGTPMTGSIVKVRLVDAAEAGQADGSTAGAATGVVSGEPQQRSSWWQMPPNWSPFLIGQERP